MRCRRASGHSATGRNGLRVGERPKPVSTTESTGSVPLRSLNGVVSHMKLTEVIASLQEQLALHGDCEVQSLIYEMPYNSDRAYPGEFYKKDIKWNEKERAIILAGD